MDASADRGGDGSERAWLVALGRYFSFVAIANLIWEFMHLPLYTIWTEGSVGELVFAAVRCTGGDVLIAGAAFFPAWLFVGKRGWPAQRFGLVTALTVASGVAFTVFSEWLNTVVRKAWAYSDLMPILPLFDVGLSPVAQWVVIPIIGFWWARRGTFSTRAKQRDPA